MPLLAGRRMSRSLNDISGLRKVQSEKVRKYKKPWFLRAEGPGKGFFDGFGSDSMDLEIAICEENDKK